MNRKIVEEAIAFVLVHREHPGTANFLWDQESYGHRAGPDGVVYGCLALAIVLKNAPESIEWVEPGFGWQKPLVRPAEGYLDGIERAAVRIADLTYAQADYLFAAGATDPRAELAWLTRGVAA